MPNTGQRARTSLLFTQIPISCFTWEPFKGSLMVSSSSLTPSELNNPYLETRAKSYQKQQVSLSEPRNTSLPLTVLCPASVCTNQQAKTLGPQPKLPSSIFPVAWSKKPVFPLLRALSGLVKVPKASQPQLGSRPQARLLSTTFGTLPRSCPRSDTQVLHEISGLPGTTPLFSTHLADDHLRVLPPPRKSCFPLISPQTDTTRPEISSVPRPGSTSAPNTLPRVPSRSCHPQFSTPM